MQRARFLWRRALFASIGKEDWPAYAWPRGVNHGKQLRSYSGRQGKAGAGAPFPGNRKARRDRATVSALLADSGDISENSEYDDAKNEQAANEVRIAEITRILGEATIVEAPTESGRVNIGSRVTVDMGGRERVFTIVGGAEANSAEGKISNESPVGAALLGHKQGRSCRGSGSHRPRYQDDHSGNRALSKL